MKIVFVLLFLMYSFSLSAQEFDVRNREFSFTLGAFDHNIEKLQSNANLDFLNYAHSSPEFFDDAIVKFGYRFDFLKRMSADIKVIIMSDLVPDNYDISTCYALNNTFSIGLGSYLNKFYISYFEQFQLQSLPDYYLVDDNSQQFKVYDLGFYLSPVIKLIENERFLTSCKFDVGFSSFLKENAVFYHKRKQSNERLIYYYNTKISYQPYFNPKLEMSLRAFNIKKTSIGFLLNSNYYFSSRNMNYNRIIHKWTSETESDEYIKMPKHRYARFETNLGIYAKW